MSELAVTALGADQPGIVAAVAEVLRERGGNVEDSAMTILGGHFAIVLIVASEDDPADLQQALTDATAEFGLTVSVTLAGQGHASAEPTHLLSVYGSDRPGILAGVTRALADLGANITDLETRLLSAEDRPVYAMVIELALPEGSSQENLESDIGEACARLGVDHMLRTIEAETY